MRERLKHYVADFHDGGGWPTVGRRFMQEAPWTAFIVGTLGFTGGEFGPAAHDMFLTSPLNAPVSTLTSTPEYGPILAAVGLVGSVVYSAGEALTYPARIGGRLRRGELNEIPDMPNIGTLVRRGIRRMRGIQDEEKNGLQISDLAKVLMQQRETVESNIVESKNDPQGK